MTLASSCARPSLVEHTPGVANKLADTLSRRFQPGTEFLVPEALVDVPECIVLPRIQNIIARLVAWKNPAVQLVPWGILPCIGVVKLLGVLILHATFRIARPPGDG